MKHVVSYIHFDNQLSIKKLRHFKDCLVKKVFDGQNIDSTDSYPAIQFKLFHQRLMVVAFDDYGMMFINKIINSDLSSVTIEDLNEELKIRSLYVKNFELKFADNRLLYRIVNYIPFHTASYVSFRSLDQHPDKQREYLRRFVKRHIKQLYTFTESDKKLFNEKLYLDVITFEERSTRLLYGTMLKPFDVVIKTNLSLPTCIGIGRFAKYGFGNITLPE